jgi:type II restriction enzyme
MSDHRDLINDIIRKISQGDIAPDKAWSTIRSLKDKYIETCKRLHPDKDAEQSWHVFIGISFQNLVYAILKGYFANLKKKDKTFQNLQVLKESELNKNEIIVRKLAIRYGDHLFLPDTDMVIANYTIEDPWHSDVLAIVSCKTSLRERIAQACYWKLKLLSNDTTKNVKVFLTTTDNDNDFVLQENREKAFGGRSRNRIIAEYELDGIYILRDDFNKAWESQKVKRYERIFEDLQKIFTSR